MHLSEISGWIWGLILLMMLLILSACEPQSKGFVLPEGDAVKGKQAFVELNCERCHSVADIGWNGSEQHDDPHVKLGGTVSNIKTYGELVTSIINPSHKISERSINEGTVTLGEGASKMELYRYNEIMTVQELVDIVTFLQDEYEVVRPDYNYPHLGY